MLVRHFVVHQIGYDNDEKLAMSARPECLTPTPALESLCHQLNHAFNSKPGKGLGGFSAEKPEFATALNGFLSEYPSTQTDEAFYGFSVATTKLLLDAMINTTTVETGFVVIAHFEYLATEYLMITLLNTKEHIEVNHELELSSKEHLDIARMQLAVKVDLTQYNVQPDLERHVAFIKGKMGRKVSDFFFQFVGCEEKVDVKEQNKRLISTVDEYLAEEGLDAQEKMQHRDSVREYMKAKIDDGSDVSVKELSTHLPSDLAAQRDFSKFVEQMETPVEPTFAPDPAAVRQLAKFSGQGGGVSLAFDRKLLGEKVVYDSVTDTLTIKGIPPNLKDQLLKAISSPVQES
jgi:nucleoid-associated protein